MAPRGATAVSRLAASLAMSFRSMRQQPFQLTPGTYGGIQAMRADSAMAFGRHIHLEFGLGVIDRGAQQSASGRGMVQACAGDVITVNPGEVHDGKPLGDAGRAWRMLYIAPALIAELAADIQLGAGAEYEFHQPVIRCAQLPGLVRTLFSAATSPERGASLQTQETLLLTLATLLHPKLPASTANIAPARTMMDDDPCAPWSLQQLADHADLSRYQLVRQFARATGLTPHAYLMQRRIHQVRQLIGTGTALGAAAAASGFADQSHMTRLFVRSFGITPGAYARACI